MSATEQKFKRDAAAITADRDHRSRIQGALKKYEAARDDKISRWQDWAAARGAISQVKWTALEHLDQYLLEFEKKISARGAIVHWAENGAQAREIILGILKAKNAKSIIKSKVMTSEEIHLNEALEQAGLRVVESDLGEFIVQLRREPPYHFVFPAMHLTRGEISALFTDKLNAAPSDDPEELTMIARRVLRQEYLRADAGISGANFAVAETGMISITENEGNARLTCALPKIHIALLGIEKVIPKLADLALLLPMLATAGAGQALTCYNTLYGGPRLSGEVDGPEEFHVVLLDNNRTALLADPVRRDALRCIRCGACLNVCPIYRNVGGHTYAATYQGPIGAVITPHFSGFRDWSHLSSASSLCGACTEVCPVKIDIHHHLLRNRRTNAGQNANWRDALAFGIFRRIVNSPGLFRCARFAGRLLQPLQRLLLRTPLDPLRNWTGTRDFPKLAAQSFREYWREQKK